MEASTKQLEKALGERVRVLLLDKGLSQEQLGQRSGLHTNYIGQIERGEKNLAIDIESLQKISRSLEIPLEQLFHSIDPLNAQSALGQFVGMLSERPVAVHALVLSLIRTVFTWETEKRK